MIPSYNRIEISVKRDTCVLLGVKGLNNLLLFFTLSLFVRKRVVFTFNPELVQENMHIYVSPPANKYYTKSCQIARKLQYSGMKFDRSNIFNLCYVQVYSLHLKSNVDSKWASKHLWGITFILLVTPLKHIFWSIFPSLRHINNYFRGELFKHWQDIFNWPTSFVSKLQTLSRQSLIEIQSIKW